MAQTPYARGLGVVWWYWGGGSLALFDSTGEVLPAASAFERR